MKRNITRIIAAVLILSMALCGCAKEDQSFSSNGLNMYLPGNYESMDVEGQTFAMSSKKSMIVGLKEEKALFESYGLYLTLEEYTDMVIQANDLSVSYHEENGLILFDYTKLIDGTFYRYLAATYEADDAFWLIQFACDMDDYDDLKDSFMKYLSTVRV